MLIGTQTAIFCREINKQEFADAIGLTFISLKFKLDPFFKVEGWGALTFLGFRRGACQEKFENHWALGT